MEIFETIVAHSSAMRLPLVAVTVTAAARAGTPVILILHWHGLRRATPLSLPGVKPPLRSVASSAVQIDQPWGTVEAMDQALLDAAWQLGAWDVERLARAPWWRLGAPAAETLACERAFGHYAGDQGEDALVAAAPDRADLMRMAATRGYIRWLFRPRRDGLWQTVAADDVTLDEDGGRTLPCPVRPRPFGGRFNTRMVYRLGRGGCLVYPANS